MENTRTIERVVVWVSAGVTSSIAAKLAIEKYKDIYPIELAICDTGSEDDDNWRFMDDLQNWLNHKVTVLKNPKYTDTIDVYRKTRYLVGPMGARCSLEMKKKPRLSFEKVDTDLQIFGFSVEEKDRLERFKQNNPLVNIECPLIERGISKPNCQELLLREGIKRPSAYDLGFKNANCLKAGCVKGGDGVLESY